MPNILAYLALILFVPLALYFFSSQKPLHATLTTFIVGLLFLPEQVGVDPPGLPLIDKYALASFCVGLGLLTVGRFGVLKSSFRGFPAAMVLLIFIGVAGTVKTNPDTLRYGITVLPGLTGRDIVSSSVWLTLQFLFPFFAGRALCKTADDGIAILRAVVFSALGYSVLILLEARLSPQMHNWVYGFHQHDFAQSMRDGGFRPLVFTRHGLSVALYVMTAVVSAATLSQLGERIKGLPPKITTGYLTVLMVICKSTAALLYTVTSLILKRFVKPKTLTKIAALLALVTLVYPLLRFTDVFPARDLVMYAARMNPDRAQSLEFRFDNEERLLTKAVERPVYGWGREFGRSRVYNEDGRDISVTDGHWIIVFGAYGIVGFVGFFLLYAWPVFVARRRFTKIQDPRARIVVASLALIMGFHLIDLLPNSVNFHFSLFISGALLNIVHHNSGAKAVV